MLHNYINRGVGILRKEGVEELIFRTNEFFQSGPPRIHFHTIKNDLYNRIVYDAPPKPYDTINIKADEVKCKIAATGNLYNLPAGGIGQIKSGQWDLPTNRTPVDDHTIIKGFKQRFEQGLKWEKTVYYEEWLDKYSKRNDFIRDGFKSPERYMEHKCHFYDHLFEEIKQNGYLSNYIGTESHIGKGYMDRIEVMVTIGRDGGIYLYEGHHRFAIARILELEIPVHVVCRHKHWQNERDYIYNNGFDKKHDTKIQKHPDLNDVL